MGYGYGGPGDRFTRNNRFAQALLQADPSINNGTVAGAAATIAKMGLAGWMMGQDARDSRAASEGMMRGMSAKPWVNPDTGSATIAREMGAGESGPSQMVPTGPAGGIDGAMAAMGNMPDNEYASRNLQGLLMQRMQEQNATNKRDEARDYNAGLLSAKLAREDRIRKETFEQAERMKGIPQPAAPKPTKAADGFLYNNDGTRTFPDVMKAPAAPPKGTNDEQNYALYRKQGGPMSFFDYQRSGKMAGQGIIFNPAQQSQGGASVQQVNTGAPQSGPSLTVLSGSRADIQAKGVAAREKSNELAELRDDPEYILSKKLAEREAAFKADNIKAMPARRGDIMTKIEREPILRETIEKVKELGEGFFGSGTPGQLAANFSESDMYAKQTLMETVKSAVGIEELIRAKKSGATFGALSDTEMSLLISAVGALDVNLGPEQLNPVLDKIMGLYSKSLGRQKTDFKEMYPDVAMPWESVPGLSPNNETSGNGANGGNENNGKAASNWILNNPFPQ